MHRMVQIRNVPDDVCRRLKSRAALAGMTLSDFLLREVERSLETPTREEVLTRIGERKPVRLRRSAATVLRAERGKR